jgi:parallel beta-helix repeat protein
MGSDGVHAAGSSNVTVSNNKFADFFPVTGQHPDAVQFFTAGTTTTAQNISITGNLIERGAGSAIQGIFFSDESGVGYSNVAVTNNTVVGTLYNGIDLSDVSGANVSGNILQAYSDQLSWIALHSVTGATVSSNQAEQYL